MERTAEDQHNKARTYAATICALKAEGKSPEGAEHRQVKYPYNMIEVDHGKLKRSIRPVRGFKSTQKGYVTITDFDVMHALRMGQAALLQYGSDFMGEVCLIERQFGICTG